MNRYAGPTRFRRSDPVRSSKKLKQNCASRFLLAVQPQSREEPRPLPFSSSAAAATDDDYRVISSSLLLLHPSSSSFFLHCFLYFFLLLVLHRCLFFLPLPPPPLPMKGVLNVKHLLAPTTSKSFGTSNIKKGKKKGKGKKGKCKGY
ncbi:hypothetical protein MUK42_36759 [Musa troglodytarum]|uniref:Uncharacterized protein n=1 Tax=Musa troglodytarum TaxID=320322 RepID=A0A9E7KFT0_9LILI|nr:hypothetical protein MUK42_36759 [Musa troglodytarum]